MSLSNLSVSAKKGGVTFITPVRFASLNGSGVCSSRVDSSDDERTASGSSPLYTRRENEWNVDLSRKAYCKFRCQISASRVDWASREC